MLNSYKYKEWFNWPLVRAHLCTLAVSVSLSATWRVPRDAFRFGGLAYGLLLTAALLAVALPVTLLQLAIGQLSQQDAVGVWRAVPFFRGIGYVRFIISFFGSTYTVIYLSMSITLFLYAATNSIPFPECIDWIIVEDVYENTMNASECFRTTFLSPVRESPEYYIAIALLVIFLWIASPFVFYNPVKLMKRTFYASVLLVIGLGTVILSGIGEKYNMSTLQNEHDWNNYLEYGLWHGAIVQALWSCQIAGGYLILAGDSVYSNTNVQWTSLAVVGSNIISSWFWLIFWFGVGGVGTGDEDTTVLAVLVQTYQVALNEDLSVTWPLLIFAMLIMSGVISILTLLYPVYDRMRRIGGIKWRLVTFGCSLAGAGVSLAVLAGRLPALTLIEDIAMPLLICLATVLEVLAFGFIYGWGTLVEDVEFLIGGELNKCWVWGWWLSPAAIVSLTTWWSVGVLRTSWMEPSWEAITFVATFVLALITVAVNACVAVGTQVQYDLIAKLKSSFQPSRHWGPRDPITHYYWLARRDEERGHLPRTRYNRRELGQLSRRPSFLTLSESVQSTEGTSPEVKKRSNSDDWIYTIGRKEYLSQSYRDIDERKRSKSLDWEVTIINKTTDINRLSNKSVFSLEKNNNV